MTPLSRISLFTMLIVSLSGWTGVAGAQTDNKQSVFSKLPPPAANSAKQKRQLRGARTYADRQRILKRQKQAVQPGARNTNVLGLNKLQNNKQVGARSSANGSARTFGPRQRVRNQSQLRGGAPAK